MPAEAPSRDDRFGQGHWQGPRREGVDVVRDGQVATRHPSCRGGPGAGVTGLLQTQVDGALNAIAQVDEEPVSAGSQTLRAPIEHVLAAGCVVAAEHSTRRKQGAMVV